MDKYNGGKQYAGKRYIIFAETTGFREHSILIETT